MSCWNCHSDQRKGLDCGVCGQRIAPNVVQQEVARQRVEYLLREVQGWDWLSGERRSSLEQDYRARIERLGNPPSATKSAPESKIVAIRKLQAPEPPPPTRERSEPKPEPNWLASTGAFLDERNIRWFHTVGALLLLSACIGYLRADWNGWGRQIVGLLLVASPAVAFWAAHRLKDSLPVSSRLLSIMAGILMPTGLIAVNHFGLGPVQLPADLWNGFSYAVSGAVLLWQAASLREVVCLYLGSFCLVMVGLPIGGTATSLLAVVVGLYYLYRGVFEEQDDWTRHYVVLSQLLTAFGVMASLPTFGDGSATVTLVLFLGGAVALATTGLLTDHLPTVMTSAALSLIGTAMTAYVLELPNLTVALASLVLGAVYLGGSRQPNTGSLATRWSALFTSGVLLLVFSERLETAPNLTELAGTLLLAAVAALYYGAAASWLGRRTFWQTAFISVYVGWLQGGLYFFPYHSPQMGYWMLALFLIGGLACARYETARPALAPILTLTGLHQFILLLGQPASLPCALSFSGYVLFWFLMARTHNDARLTPILTTLTALTAPACLPVGAGLNEPIPLTMLAAAAALVATHRHLPQKWTQAALTAGLLWSLTPVCVAPDAVRVYLAAAVWVAALCLGAGRGSLVGGVALLAAFGYGLSDSHGLNLLAFAGIWWALGWDQRRRPDGFGGLIAWGASLVCAHSLAGALGQGPDLTMVCWLAVHALILFSQSKGYLPEFAAVTTFAPVLVRAALLDQGGFEPLGTVALLYAPVLLWLGSRSRSNPVVNLGLFLLPLGTALRFTAGLGLEETMWAWLAWGAVFAVVEGYGKPVFVPVATLLSVVGAVSFSVDLHTLGLATAAVAAMRHTFFRRQADALLTLGLSHLSYWTWLGQIGIERPELYLLPVGLSLLVWGRLQSQDQLQWIAVAVWGVPPLWSSALAGDLPSALWVGAYGFVLLLVGGFRNWKVPQLGGTALLLAEVTVHAVRRGVQLPWQVNAALLGGALVTAGIVFEMRRRGNLSASHAVD